MAGGSKKPIAVYGAILANFAIAVTKFITALATGSSSMLSEGIHSVADTGNQALLLLGIQQSKKPADERHPFGYGKELYFWSLIVAMVLFGVGGGMSIYEGISHIQHPSELTDPTQNYIVLAAAAIFESIAFTIALRELLRVEGSQGNFWDKVRNSKDPAIFVVLFEDAAALTGLVLAFIGIYLAHRTQNPHWDGIASITIGIVLSTVSIFLAMETKGLLLGESMDPEFIRSIRQIAREQDHILEVNRPLTMHLGPDNVLLNMEVIFQKDLNTDQLTAAVDGLEEKIQNRHPRIKRLFIEAEGLKELRKR